MHYKLIKKRPVKHYWYDVTIFNEKFKIEATSYANARDKAMTYIMKNFNIIKQKG